MKTRAMAGSRLERAGSALALRRAAGAKANSKVGESQPEAGEDHQKHERIDDRHVQWMQAAGALGADCVARESRECGERFNTLLTIE